MKPTDAVTFATLFALAASAGAAPQRDVERDGNPAAIVRWVANAGDARSVDERGSAPRRMGAEIGHAAATLGDGSRSLRGSWASDPVAAFGAFGSLETSRAPRAPARTGPHPTAKATDTARGAKRPTAWQVANNTQREHGRFHGEAEPILVDGSAVARRADVKLELKDLAQGCEALHRRDLAAPEPLDQDATTTLRLTAAVGESMRCVLTPAGALYPTRLREVEP